MSVRDAFRAQAEQCAKMGSPFTARLCALMAERLAPGTAVADRVLGWPSDPRGRADALPLRLAGALHALVLQGTEGSLASVYPPGDVRCGDDALWAALARAMDGHAGEIVARLERPPQTNEAMRSAALCPGFLSIAATTGLPLVISEPGASAGLNLVWDRFCFRFGNASWGDPAARVCIAPDWRGPPPPLPATRVLERAGCDRAPPDLEVAQDRLRLRSFVWADQRARLARMDAAIATARGAGVRVETADAGDWLEPRLAEPWPGRAHVVYHSIFSQYLDAGTEAHCRGLIEAAGARATRSAPLAWLRMESDGQEPGAALALTLWPEGETQVLARADFHGSWIDWRGWR